MPNADHSSLLERTSSCEKHYVISIRPHITVTENIPQTAIESEVKLLHHFSLAFLSRFLKINISVVRGIQAAKRYLKHKIQAEVHEVSSIRRTCAFNNVEICKSCTGDPGSVAQNLYSAIIQLLWFGGEWEPVMTTCRTRINRYHKCTWVSRC